MSSFALCPSFFTVMMYPSIPISFEETFHIDLSWSFHWVVFSRTFFIPRFTVDFKFFRRPFSVFLFTFIGYQISHFSSFSTCGVSNHKEIRLENFVRNDFKNWQFRKSFFHILALPISLIFVKRFKSAYFIFSHVDISYYMKIRSESFIHVVWLKMNIMCAKR